MNKKEYLQQLSNRLSKLPREEMLEAMNYYNEYFEEAGEENEAEVIEKLGPPEKIAAQIISECAIKNIDAPARSVKHGLSTVWLVILAIFAAPIAGPLAIAMAAVFIVVVFTILVALVAVLIAAVAAAGGGLMAIGVGIISLFGNFASGIAIIGTGMVAVGVGILILYASFALTKYVLKGLSMLFKKVIKKGNKYEEFN